MSTDISGVGSFDLGGSLTNSSPRMLTPIPLSTPRELRGMPLPRQMAEPASEESRYFWAEQPLIDFAKEIKGPLLVLDKYIGIPEMTIKNISTAQDVNDAILQIQKTAEQYMQTKVPPVLEKLLPVNTAPLREQLDPIAELVRHSIIFMKLLNLAAVVYPYIVKVDRFFEYISKPFGRFLYYALMDYVCYLTKENNPIALPSISASDIPPFKQIFRSDTSMYRSLNAQVKGDYEKIRTFPMFIVDILKQNKDITNSRRLDEQYQGIDFNMLNKMRAYDININRMLDFVFGYLRYHTIAMAYIFRDTPLAATFLDESIVWMNEKLGETSNSTVTTPIASPSTEASAANAANAQRAANAANAQRAANNLRASGARALEAQVLEQTRLAASGAAALAASGAREASAQAERMRASGAAAAALAASGAREAKAQADRLKAARANFRTRLTVVRQRLMSLFASIGKIPSATQFTSIELEIGRLQGIPNLPPSEASKIPTLQTKYSEFKTNIRNRMIGRQKYEELRTILTTYINQLSRGGGRRTVRRSRRATRRHSRKHYIRLRVL
jgi:hypothetical protein